MDEIIARRLQDEQGNILTQPLLDHLLGVAAYCRELGAQVGLAYTCLSLGLLHDKGKITKNFQKYINEKTNQKVDHSSAGGVYLYNEFSKIDEDRGTKIAGEVMAYVVFAHHGLLDLLDLGQAELGFDRRRNYNRYKNYDEEEMMEFRTQELEPKVEEVWGESLEEIIKKSAEELKNLFHKLKKLSCRTTDKCKKNAFNYYIGATVRLLLSILKEGDIYDSANAFTIQKEPLVSKDVRMGLWEKGTKAIEEKYMGFRQEINPSLLNQTRTMLSNEAREVAIQVPAGSLKVESPTGGGKTLMTSRAALHSCVEFRKDRFFYVTAFLSVLEQNADEIKTLFHNDENILEHHSNAVEEREEKGLYGEKGAGGWEEQVHQYMIDSWESPIILTTMVQYLNTLFKGKSSNLRRFCKLINAVIVLDEVQNLPTKVVHNFNLMNNFLSEIMGATIIHCTATQPELDAQMLDYKTVYSEVNDGYLAKMDEAKQRVFERVKACYLKKEVPFSTEELVEHVEENCDKSRSVLIIANTKKAVHKIYEELKYMKDQGFSVYELTTNQCAEHRLGKIKEIKEKLNAGEKVMAVSTQLIEAGVDVDFAVVYRSMAGIPSLIQAMGRCNREGKLPFGRFYIFELATENTDKLGDIKRQKERTLSCLSNVEKGELDIVSLKKRYYHNLYRNATDKDYPLETDESLIQILGTNKACRGEYFSEKGDRYGYALGQNFKTAAESFELIEENGITVIVSYPPEFGERSATNKKLINQYRESMDRNRYSEAKKQIRLLQPYTINIQRIEEYSQYLERIGDTYVLQESYYNKEIGLNAEKLEVLIY